MTVDDLEVSLALFRAQGLEIYERKQSPAFKVAFVAAPGGDGCYWERLSGFGGTMDEIISNDLPSGRAIVEISASHAGFRSGGCGPWDKMG